jgi:hypothetical protein
MDNNMGKLKDKPSLPPETQEYNADNDDTQSTNAANNVLMPFQAKTQGYNGDDNHTQDKNIQEV